MKTSLGLCLALMVFLSSDGIIRGTEAEDRKRNETCDKTKDVCKRGAKDRFSLVCLGGKCVHRIRGSVEKGGACTEAQQCVGGVKKMDCKDEKCKEKEATGVPSGAQRSAQGLGLGMMMMAATVFVSSPVAILGM